MTSIEALHALNTTCRYLASANAVEKLPAFRSTVCTADAALGEAGHMVICDVNPDLASCYAAWACIGLLRIC